VQHPRAANIQSLFFLTSKQSTQYKYIVWTERSVLSVVSITDRQTFVCSFKTFFAVFSIHLRNYNGYIYIYTTHMCVFSKRAPKSHTNSLPPTDNNPSVTLANPAVLCQPACRRLVQHSGAARHDSCSRKAMKLQLRSTCRDIYCYHLITQ
jgi:hypothetical protein